jgi:hypothetical protein
MALMLVLRAGAANCDRPGAFDLRIGNRAARRVNQVIERERTPFLIGERALDIYVVSIVA